MKRILAAFAVLLLLTTSAFAALEGPDSCEAGTLAIIRSDCEAVWTVYPSTYSNSFATADGGKTLFFASPVKGEVAIIAASVNEDGKPTLDALTLRNGMDDPEPTPTPEPGTLEEIIKTGSVGKDRAELAALAESFEYVVAAIDQRTVTTPAGARETFRAVWANKGSAVKTTALNDLSALIRAISAQIDNSSVNSLRNDYARCAKALRSAAR